MEIQLSALRNVVNMILTGNPILPTMKGYLSFLYRSAAMVYAPSADDGWIDSLLNGIKRFLGIKIPSVWEGDFDFGAIAPSFDEDKEMLRKKIEALYSLDSRAFFTEMIGVLIFLRAN